MTISTIPVMSVGDMVCTGVFLSFVEEFLLETFSSFLLLRVFGVLFDMSALKRCYIGLPSAIATVVHNVLADTRNSALVDCKYKISPRYPQQCTMAILIILICHKFYFDYSTKIGLIRLLFQSYVNRCSAYHHRIILASKRLEIYWAPIIQQKAMLSIGDFSLRNCSGWYSIHRLCV